MNKHQLNFWNRKKNHGFFPFNVYKVACINLWKLGNQFDGNSTKVQCIKN